ncbi:MAG: hypothetical protein Q9191_003381 [Dirinaria sp. TL-2023a]
MASSVKFTTALWLVFVSYGLLTSALNYSRSYISDDQIKQAGITRGIADAMEKAWTFEKFTWATGSVHDDPFYEAPPPSLSAIPGQLLKVEEATDPTKYTIPPGTALSRILFQTRTLAGAAVPASAFVLWPYSPRSQPGGTVPVVAWAHGTSGLFGNDGPSHLKGLSYQFAAPFVLALQGYAVVGPDYAGLGVSQDARGNPVDHEYLSNPSHAHDLFYSVQAAQTAFKQLSQQFVILGHSQGGGAAWAAAQRQAIEPVKGYLGTIACAPVTNIFNLPSDGPLLPLLVALVVYALQKINPKFDYHEILTPQAARRWELYLQLEPGAGVTFALFQGVDLLQPGWRQNPYLQDFVARTSNGGKPIGGPMLVLQGLADTNLDAGTASRAVQATCSAFPRSQLQYQALEGISHVPLMYASQQTWLQWIADRFAGKPIQEGCSSLKTSPLLPPQRYSPEVNWIVESATEVYELAMP